MNRLYFILISILPIMYIIHEIRKKRFSITESFWWVIAAFGMLVLAIFPYSIDYIASKFGVEYAPSLLFVICIIFLVLINFRNSKRISEQEIKIIELAQNISILKSERSEKNENK